MNHSRKVVVMPYDSVGQNQIIESKSDFEKPKRLRIDRDMDKFHKLLNIVLKIAQHKGYDEDLHLVDRDGNSINETDIANLLQNALSHEKVLVGEAEFIKLLYESN